MKNCLSDEGYQLEQVSDRHLRVTDNTPWPHDLIYGYLYAIVRQFKPDDSTPSITHIYLNPNNPDADGAVYDITW
mgnify:CR=1 FL=1